MHEESKDRLLGPGETGAALDVRHDYHYGRGIAIEGEKVHLRDYWRIVRRRLWLPLSAVFVVGTVTTILMIRSPSIHEGVTTIQIDRERDVLDFKELKLVGDDSQYLNTQLHLLKSPVVAYQVVKTMDLENNPDFAPRVGQKAVQGAQKVPIAQGESDQRLEMQRLEPYIERLRRGIDATRLRETRLVQIKYRHTNPELARQITDTWADVFVKHNLDSRQEGNKSSVRELEDRIADTKLALREAEQKLNNYRRDHQVLDFGEKENTVIARLVDLNRQLLQVESERKTLQTSVELTRKEADPSNLPEVQRDPAVQDLTKKLTELKQKQAQLLAEVTPEYPEAKQVKQQIDALEGELRAAHQRILSGIEKQYQAAAQRETRLRKDLNEQYGETMKQNEGAIQAKIYQQDIDTNRALLDKLLHSQKEIVISSASQRNNVRVTEYSPVRGPVGPPRTRNIVMSIFLSLLGGIGLVLFLDYLNNKIESVEDIDRYLHLPALGVIPIFPLGKARKRLTGTAASKALTTAAWHGNGHGGGMILTEVESTSSIAESYRQLRTAVLLSSAGHPPRTMLITSSQPAEGKTTTSVNMAISLAQTGAAVVIVDADLRRPRVHKIFGLKNSRGLCNYLAGECEISSLIQTALPNLYVLPVGPLPPNPAELLGSTKMRQVVEMLSSNFDYVVIDSPPVASFADSLILSSMVEGVIVVVKAGFTPREMAQRTKAHLHSVGAKILGVVINHIKLQPHDYYYYSTYYSRYYYQSGGEGAEAGLEQEPTVAKNA
jgi:succinoglycan biosynthesis transport protein ExoP